MLAVENLDVFHGDAQALDGVSLEVEEGAIVAIVGANGAGKTSLIRTIAGMHRPARGRVVLRGADIARRSIQEMRRAGNFDAAQSARWQAQLEALLPDVVAGDRIAALKTQLGVAMQQFSDLQNQVPPVTAPITGMITSPTSEDTMLPKAAPMITPIARSTTLPFSANFLKSSNTDIAPILN